MKTIVKKTLLLFLIGILIAGFSWFCFGFEVSVVVLMSYGLILEILSILEKKK